MTEDTAIDTRQFRFSAIVDEVYQDIIPSLLELEDRLNEEIELSEYTDVVKTICFIPMLLEEREEYEEKLEYDGEKNELILQVFSSSEEPLLVVFVNSLKTLQEQMEENILDNFILQFLESL